MEMLSYLALQSKMMNKIKNYMEKIKEYFKKIPKEIIYIFQTFFITRIALTTIGISALAYKYNPTRPDYSPHNIFNIWGLWDTGWYLEIAKMGYSAKIDSLGTANYGFFPLYPLFIKVFSFITQNYFIAALIASNLFLILAALYLYKLARIDCDEKTSLRIIKYLFIFPASFILSAALSESLFLFLFITCLYYTKKQKWLLSGIFGMFLTLTKPYGILILLPIVYEYIKSKKEINFFESIKDTCSILLIPTGIALFALYTYFLTGDILAYPHIKQSGWGNYLINPIKNIHFSIVSGNTSLVWAALVSITVILALIFFYKKIGFYYFIAGIPVVLFSIITTSSTASTLRYLTAVFPIYIILGKISENKEIDEGLMIFLLLMQGFLMAFWTIQSGIII